MAGRKFPGPLPSQNKMPLPQIPGITVTNEVGEDTLITDYLCSKSGK